MIKRLLKLGNPRLQLKAKPVQNFNSQPLNQLIQDLFDTMKANAGVGIAAPQIGVPLQVIVFGFDSSPRYPHAKSIPDSVLINPSFFPIGEESYEDWEGCLSTKPLRGLARRYKHIHYKGYDQFGHYYEREVSGFHARLIQHELDHLNGILFIERVPNLKFFGFESEISELVNQVGEALE
jgi:peptide deformylase